MISLLPRWTRPRSRPDASHPHITVYTRAQCCCCHKALDLLKDSQRRHGFSIEEVDVDSDPELAGRTAPWCRSWRSTARSGSRGWSTPCCSSGCSSPRLGSLAMAWALPEGAVLGIFGRRPEPGRVKTRLAPPSAPRPRPRCTRRCPSTCSTPGPTSGCSTPSAAGSASSPPRTPAPGSTHACPPCTRIQPQAEEDLGLQIREFFEGEFERL